jgi:hypothetical protein
VLLHHIIGGVDGKKGAWAYVEGGMGKKKYSICFKTTSLLNYDWEYKKAQFQIVWHTMPKLNSAIKSTYLYHKKWRALN